MTSSTNSSKDKWQWLMFSLLNLNITLNIHKMMISSTKTYSNRSLCLIRNQISNLIITLNTLKRMMISIPILLDRSHRTTMHQFTQRKKKISMLPWLTKFPKKFLKNNKNQHKNHLPMHHSILKKIMISMLIWKRTLCNKLTMNQILLFSKELDSHQYTLLLIPKTMMTSMQNWDNQLHMLKQI